MTLPIALAIIALMGGVSAKLQAHYTYLDVDEKTTAVFVPPKDSDIYLSDEKPLAPLCLEFCNEKGEPQ